MNAAESLIATARATGIDVCFVNPGTSEMPLVPAPTGLTSELRQEDNT